MFLQPYSDFTYSYNSPLDFVFPISLDTINASYPFIPLLSRIDCITSLLRYISDIRNTLLSFTILLYISIMSLLTVHRLFSYSISFDISFCLLSSLFEYIIAYISSSDTSPKACLAILSAPTLFS